MNKSKIWFLGIISFIVLILGVILLPLGTVAHHSPFLIHATPPQVSSGVINRGESVMLMLSVQNVSPVAFITPLCVRDVVGGQSIHLGCVPAYSFSPGAGSMFSFNVTRPMHTPGRHTIIFSYMAPDGRWHEIMSSSHHLMRATFQVR